MKGNKTESPDSSEDEDDTHESAGLTADDDNASVASSTTAEPLRVPKPSSVNKATTVVADVIKNKGQYGRFAQRWFSKGGWKSDGLRKQGISTSEDDLTLTPEQKKQAEDSLPSDNKDEAASAPVDDIQSQQAVTGETTLTNLIPRILKTTRLYFTSHSFYFSYDYDISRSLSRQEPSTSSVPLHRRFDPLVSIAYLSLHLL